MSDTGRLTYDATEYAARRDVRIIASILIVIDTMVAIKCSIIAATVATAIHDVDDSNIIPITTVNNIIHFIHSCSCSRWQKILLLS